MKGRILRFLAALAVLIVGHGFDSRTVLAQGKREPIDFNRQVRPILSDYCFSCHGPDEQERKGKLRLDTSEGAFAKLRRGGHAVVPGKPNESGVLQRILTDEPSEKMPPPRTMKEMKKEQIETLRLWIEQGAPFAQHWAFVAPKRPSLPATKMQGWARNGIDHFILARLEKEGWKPSPEADRRTLIRRLTLDLLGLPPTPQEVDAFVNDTAPNAYEKVVDRLLASPHFGERMAVDWLDAARFADTHGYHIDSGRDMSAWREWVIDSFNSNLPFDQFTIEQLAGDLLPNATPRQKIASGFNRNHMINFEGGAIPEEYHNAYIVDRVTTTGTVWLGLTMTCAQCHDHKYDPISQREFYQIYAFFHNVPENGLDGSKGNAAPVLKAPSKSQEAKLAQLDERIRKLETQLKNPDSTIDAEQLAWEKNAGKEVRTVWQPIVPSKSRSAGGATLKHEPNHFILATGANPATESYEVVGSISLAMLSGLKVEVAPHSSTPTQGLGRSANGNFVMTGIKAWLVDGTKETPLALKAATASFEQKDYPVRGTLGGSKGWGIFPNVKDPVSATFTLASPTKVTGDASVKVVLEFLAGYGQHQFANFRLSATDSADPMGKNKIPDQVASILHTPSVKRTPTQQQELQTYFRANVSIALAASRAEIDGVKKAKAEVESAISSTMVMQEMATPRDTYMLIRGDYARKGEKVKAGLPAALPPLPNDSPTNRLGLARWLVDPSQPLTSRVIVNRYWQLFFGTGLVKTVEDFGSQAEPPSHPELLDWLAVEFQNPSPAPIGNGAKQRWAIKELLRMIVTSATYRQSSRVTPELIARDPENRLLARGPRFRLQAEFIRDQALAVSGLLNREIGGKSVSPYQPVGLWQELAARQDSKNWSAQFFVQSKGADLYRRTMYTFWKRTSPPPQLVTFDAPDREICTVRRSRTNTPLQALVLMNDPTYVEASRKLAERMISSGTKAEDRLAFAFRLATSREPTAKESAILRRVLDQQLTRFQAQPTNSEKLLTVGDSPRDERLVPNELAAYTIVASVILNLDEVVTKN